MSEFPYQCFCGRRFYMVYEFGFIPKSVDITKICVRCANDEYASWKEDRVEDPYEGLKCAWRDLKYWIKKPKMVPFSVPDFEDNRNLWDLSAKGRIYELSNSHK